MCFGKTFQNGNCARLVFQNGISGEKHPHTCGNSNKKTAAEKIRGRFLFVQSQGRYPYTMLSATFLRSTRMGSRLSRSVTTIMPTSRAPSRGDTVKGMDRAEDAFTTRASRA
jgi:hypothetical protein